MTIPASGPWVWGDRTRLRQVALNLISNAVKFTGAGRNQPEPGVTSTCVRDGGRARHRHRHSRRRAATIFDEFRRSERAVTRGYGGLGLGLAICRRLVELHGGTMEVASAGEEGAGSTILVHAADRPRAHAQTPTASRQPSRDAARPGVGAGRRRRSNACRRTCSSGAFQVDLLPLEDTPRLAGALADGAICSRGARHHAANERMAGWRCRRSKATRRCAISPSCSLPVRKPTGALLEIGYLTKPIELAELNQALDQQWLPGDGAAAQRTFLVVDDDPNTLDLHARIVQAHAPTNRVLKAHNGQEALEILARASVDLVLLDLMMPGMDGFAVLDVDAQPGVHARHSGDRGDRPGADRGGDGAAEPGRGDVLGKGLYSLEETLAHLETALAHERKLSSEAQRLVRRAMAFLHEHYMESLTRRAIARTCGAGRRLPDLLLPPGTGDDADCLSQPLPRQPGKEHCSSSYFSSKSITARSRWRSASPTAAISAASSSREVGMAPDAYRRT
jgi:hypothetical protein